MSSSVFSTWSISVTETPLFRGGAGLLWSYTKPITIIAAYGSSVREQAARNLEVVRQIYSYGRITLLDVITEQRRYIDIETAYTDVLLDAYVARVALEQAIGARLH